MKLIIDIDNKDYEKLKDGYIPFSILDTMQNGIFISDNATNGEVLETMFLPNRITKTNDIVHVEYDFTPEWWNAPYQEGRRWK